MWVKREKETEEGASIYIYKKRIKKETGKRGINYKI